jgi:hypothetical protein
MRLLLILNQRYIWWYITSMYNIVIHYCNTNASDTILYCIHQYMHAASGSQVASCTIAVAASFSAALYSAHEFVRLVCEESMLKADF